MNIRKEFEDWIWEKYKDIFWYDLERNFVLAHYGNGYKTEFLNVRWESWLASRDLIIVKMPTSATNSGSRYIETVRNFIEKQGIKTK